MAMTADELAQQMEQQQRDAIDYGDMEKYWGDMMRDYQSFFPQNHVPSFSDLLSPGGLSFSMASLGKAVASYLFHEVLYNGQLLVTIVILTILSMLVETLQAAFERATISKITYSIITMVIIVIAVNSFQVAIGTAKEAITRMTDFMLAMLPLLLTLLASIGSVMTVSLMHPVIVAMVHVVGTVIYTTVFPLLFFSAVLHLASAISSRYKLTHLAELLQKIAMGILGLMLTIFLGVISIKGATGSVSDGVTMKTAKFIAGNFVPVIGRTFSDAADTMVTASLLVKNAIGIAGVVILIALCALPAIKILTMALIYQGTAAIMQPLGDSPVVTSLKTIGQTLIYIFAALGAVALMFFLAVTMILMAGNVTMMMR